MPNSRQAGSATLSALEDAVNLLRRTPLSTLLLHWTGSAPFALAALLFWNDITQYRPSSAACLADALALAVLLTWMSCWRAVFAARLRAQLSGAAVDGIAIWRMAGYQSLLAAAKLIALPLSALIVFPLASSVAFFRYASVLCCRADLNFRQIIARARKLAAIDVRQSWATLAAIALLQILVTLNVATALVLLPQLVRMLTGYESVFSRAGMSFLSSPLFTMASLCIGWLAIDPFLQAVYCVMYFRRESLETGEDLRAALRSLVGQAILPAAAFQAASSNRRAGTHGSTRLHALLCIFLLAATRALAAIPPEPLRQSIEQTMQAHEYDWRLPPETAAQNQPSWLLNLVNQILHGFAWVVKQLGNLLSAVFRWLFDRFNLQSGESGAAPAHALSLGIYIVIGVILLLAALLALRILRASRTRPRPAAVSVSVPIQLEDESVTPDRLPEDQWIEMGENCLREQNFRLALRAFYLANLAWLGRREWIAIHPGKTNGEYAADLRRRAREFPEARAIFAQNLSAFERTWYGMHAVAPEDVESFRERNNRMKTVVPA